MKIHQYLLILRIYVTTEELHILNNPLTRLNFNGMLRKIMQ